MISEVYIKDNMTIMQGVIKDKKILQVIRFLGKNNQSDIALIELKNPPKKIPSRNVIISGTFQNTDLNKDGFPNKITLLGIKEANGQKPLVFEAQEGQLSFASIPKDRTLWSEPGISIEKNGIVEEKKGRTYAILLDSIWTRKITLSIMDPSWPIKRRPIILKASYYDRELPQVFIFDKKNKNIDGSLYAFQLGNYDEDVNEKAEAERHYCQCNIEPDLEP